MTPIQRQMLELEVRNLALEHVNDWLVRHLRSVHACVPEPTRALLAEALSRTLRTLQAAAIDQAQAPIPGCSPEMAAAQAARRNRAFDDLATKIEDELQAEPTQAEMKFLGELQQELARKRAAQPPQN